MRMPNDPRGGGIMPRVGLAGMRERVQQLGGQLKVQSDGKGASIQAILPVAKAAAVEATAAKADPPAVPGPH